LLHVGVVPFRIPAIIPIIGRFLLTWCFLPLNINGGWRPIRDAVSVASISSISTVIAGVSPPTVIAGITPATVIPRAEAIPQAPAISAISAPAVAISWIVAPYAVIKAHTGMVMSTVVVPIVMMPAPIMASVMPPVTPIPPMPISPERTSKDQSDHGKDDAQ
jgi:hypothetical protein